MENKLLVLFFLVLSAKSILYATSEGTIYYNTTLLSQIDYTDIISLGAFQYNGTNASIPYIVSQSGGLFYWDNSTWVSLFDQTAIDILFVAQSPNQLLFLATLNMVYTFSYQNKDWDSISVPETILALTTDYIGNAYVGALNSKGQVRIYNLSSNFHPNHHEPLDW
jgi:hypothetical protein